MSGVQNKPRPSKSKRQALSVWELPKLLRSVHHYRRRKRKAGSERQHFRAILAFVHRNRFACASQIQRRFPKYLGSDRTARRHLAEMESLGFLSVVETNHVSPLWPKVYFVTRRGLARLRQAFKEQGLEWSESLQDRRRSEGVSAQHVLHELLTTEFLLFAWEASQACDGLEILTIQRRSLAKHKSFKVVAGGRSTRLQPDGMFLYRQQGKGMMCCFVEMDLGTMSLKQMKEKFRRYQSWAESAMGIAYLKTLYKRNGAESPVVNYRILVVIGRNCLKSQDRRLSRLVELSQTLHSVIRNRLWFTSTHQFHLIGKSQRLLLEPVWRCLPNAKVENQSVQRSSLNSLFEC